MSFAHLHLHSQYSLLDGANRLDDVIGAAVAAGMPALALTDHGNLFGAVDFYQRARKAGIKPILGIEAYVAQGSRLDRESSRSSSNHLVLLARDLARGRRRDPGRFLWAGATSAVIVLAVHGLFDFVWHVPALPLVAMSLAGAGSAPDRKSDHDTESPTNEIEG